MAGQNISGVVDLPHSFGTERTQRVLALTHDQNLADQALEVGAQSAGNLLYELRKRIILIRDYDLVVASMDMKKDLSLRRTTVPRILSKFSMTPSSEMRTLVKADEFVETVEKFVNNTRMRWATDRHGNVTVPLGKVLLPTSHLVENCERLLQDFYRMRPLDFGSGPRGRPKNVGKYVLGIIVTMTEGKALPIDLSTVPFCEHFGKGPPPYYTENNMPYGVKYSETIDTSKPRIPVLPNGHPVEPIIIKKPSSDETLLFKAINRKKRSL
jgi:ribosomal protein L1